MKAGLTQDSPCLVLNHTHILKTDIAE